MTLPAAILAGGLATRLRPLTVDIPKALIPINGKPFIAHQLELLRSRGISEVVICAWYRSEQIEEFAGSGSRFGLSIRYSYDGPEPLGTGGALRKALPLLGGAFFVLYGDSYLPIDYSAVEKAFTTSGNSALMTVYRNRDMGDRSNVRFEDGHILSYSKTERAPEMQHIDYGLGVFNRSTFEPYPENIKLDLAAIYQDLLDKGHLAAYEVDQRFYEVGTFAGIRDLEDYLNQKEEK